MKDWSVYVGSDLSTVTVRVSSGNVVRLITHSHIMYFSPKEARMLSMALDQASYVAESRESQTRAEYLAQRRDKE